MKIVKIDGTLGQQMFQYAFFLSLLGSDGEARMTGQRFMLGNLFNISHGDRFDAVGTSLLPWKARKDPYKELPVVAEPVDGSYAPAIIKEAPTDALFTGSWLSYRYFDRIEETVRSEYKQDQPLPLQLETLRCRMANNIDNTVAMHIVAGGRANPCTRDYYNWAVANINTYVPDAEFFIFTDNPKWVQDNIVGLPDNARLTSSKGLEDIELMRLMASAGHVIISATLADWWAAYLNENPDKIVIAPQSWSKTSTPPDLLPLHWTIIPVT